MKKILRLELSTDFCLFSSNFAMGKTQNFTRAVRNFHELSTNTVSKRAPFFIFSQYPSQSHPDTHYQRWLWDGTFLGSKIPVFLSQKIPNQKSRDFWDFRDLDFFASRINFLPAPSHPLFKYCFSADPGFLSAQNFTFQSCSLIFKMF